MKKVIGSLFMAVSILTSQAMAEAKVVRGEYVFISGDTAREIQQVLAGQKLFDLQELFRSREISTDSIGGPGARVFMHGKNLGALTDANDPKLLTSGSSAFGVTEKGHVVITGYLANILVDVPNLSRLIRCTRVQTDNFTGFPGIVHNRCELE